MQNFSHDQILWSLTWLFARCRTTSKFGFAALPKMFEIQPILSDANIEKKSKQCFSPAKKQQFDCNKQKTIWNLGKYKFLYMTQVLKINTLADRALQSQAMRERQQDDVLSFEFLSVVLLLWQKCQTKVKVSVWCHASTLNPSPTSLHRNVFTFGQTTAETRVHQTTRGCTRTTGQKHCVERSRCAVELTEKASVSRRTVTVTSNVSCKHSTYRARPLSLNT